MPAQPPTDDANPARPPARSPSIYEVARAAGVSVATVSRVLNDKGPVRAETRAQVLAAVAGLGYVPHSAARSLSTRRTMVIGVLLPDMHGAFFSELVRGIDLAARGAGYHLLVSGSHSEPGEAAAALRALHGRVDGLILMAPGLDVAALRSHLPRRGPVVLLNDDGHQSHHHSLRIDNRHGARLAMDHLLDLGHRTIAFLAGPEGNTDAAERLLGYREALTAAGIEADPRLELRGDFSEESGVRGASRIAALRPRPTAVFAANDAMAIGCLAGLRERGLAVPADLSLVGFDDVPIARYLTPPLTTVHVPIAELGRRALRCALDALDAGGDGTTTRAVIAPTLAVRASAAAPPAAGSSSATRNQRRMER